MIIFQRVWDTLPTPTLPTGHFTDRTLHRQDTLPTRHFTDRTLYRQDTLPTGHFTDNLSKVELDVEMILQGAPRPPQKPQDRNCEIQIQTVLNDRNIRSTIKFLRGIAHNISF